MGIFSGISSLFGFSQPQPIVPDMLAAQMAAAANNNGPEAKDNEEFSLTDTTSAILKATLANQTVIRYGNPAPVRFHANSVSLEKGGMGGGRMVSLDDSQSIPKGETVSLNVKLAHKATDYDLVSANQAMVNVLKAIPKIGHLIEAKPVHATPPTYADVEAELLPLLAKHKDALGANNIAIITQYLEANKGARDAVTSSWRSGIEASHFEGKVRIRVNAQSLPSDKDAVTSSDEGIVHYFEQHRAHILEQVKQKALALGVLKPEDLTHLDMDVQATGWNIEATFGTKASVTTDADGHTLTPIELAKKMTETPLAKVDTKKLGEIFTQVLTESKDLPPIMPRIMNGHMLKEILQSRLPNDPEIAAVIAKHEMFKSEADLKAEEELAAKNHKIIVSEVAAHSIPNTNADELSMSFELPHGVKLTDVLMGIANAKAQMQVGAQPRMGFAAGIAA